MKGLTPHPKDLHVLGISEKDFVRRGIRIMLFAVLLALCMFALVTYSMGATPILLILFLLLFPVAVWIHMVRGIEVKATARRSDMDIAVAVFLDLVNVLLAGGAGAETALLAAADHQGPIIAAGSLYLVGAIRGELMRRGVLPDDGSRDDVAGSTL